MTDKLLVSVSPDDIAAFYEFNNAVEDAGYFDHLHEMLGIGWFIRHARLGTAFTSALAAAGYISDETVLESAAMLSEIDQLEAEIG